MQLEMLFHLIMYFRVLNLTGLYFLMGLHLVLMANAVNLDGLTVKYSKCTWKSIFSSMYHMMSLALLFLYCLMATAHILTLQDWAESKNIILFILSPHCSNILQPLDIGCFGPLKACYNREAQLFMRKNPGCKITRYNIGQMSCSPYQKGLSAQNLISSFSKSGIYPFNPKAVDTSELAPATIYPTATSDEASTMNNIHIFHKKMTTLPLSNLTKLPL